MCSIPDLPQIDFRSILDRAQYDFGSALHQSQTDHISTHMGLIWCSRSWIDLQSILQNLITNSAQRTVSPTQERQPSEVYKASTNMPIAAHRRLPVDVTKSRKIRGPKVQKVIRSPHGETVTYGRRLPAFLPCYNPS